MSVEKSNGRGGSRSVDWGGERASYDVLLLFPRRSLKLLVRCGGANGRMGKGVDVSVIGRRAVCEDSRGPNDLRGCLGCLGCCCHTFEIAFAMFEMSTTKQLEGDFGGMKRSGRGKRRVGSDGAVG